GSSCPAGEPSTGIQSRVGRRSWGSWRGPGRDYRRGVAGLRRGGFPGRLRQSRRQAPRNALRAVDLPGNRADARLLCPRLYYLFADARAAALRLPAVGLYGRGALQLLPQLQMQPASGVPAVQARSGGNGQVLRLLRPRLGTSEDLRT